MAHRGTKISCTKAHLHTLCLTQSRSALRMGLEGQVGYDVETGGKPSPFPPSPSPSSPPSLFPHLPVAAVLFLSLSCPSRPRLFVGGPSGIRQTMGPAGLRRDLGAQQLGH